MNYFYLQRASLIFDEIISEIDSLHCLFSTFKSVSFSSFYHSINTHIMADVIVL